MLASFSEGITSDTVYVYVSSFLPLRSSYEYSIGPNVNLPPASVEAKRSSVKSPPLSLNVNSSLATCAFLPATTLLPSITTLAPPVVYGLTNLTASGSHNPLLEPSVFVTTVDTAVDTALILSFERAVISALTLNTPLPSSVTVTFTV